MNPKKILILAGESSGDLLGADLAGALLQYNSNLQLLGMGGEKMRQAGVDILVDNRSLNVMGWWEILKSFSIIRKAMRAVKTILTQQSPDLLILIDYPGFNLRMAKVAKRAGIKVLYYVSPQIWAWRYGRIKTIRENVDHMAVLFAFEAAIYQKENVPATFVGHPLSELVKADQSPASILAQYQLSSERPIIALFPGSRKQEVQRLLPVMSAAKQIIQEKIPEAQFVMPLANSLQLEDLPAPFIENIKLINNNTYNILSVCTAAMVKSGTGTLEVALSQVPLLVIYKCHLLNYWIARSVIKIKQIGLCNIVAGKTIAKELIQSSATPQAIAAEIILLINDPSYRQQSLQNLTELRIGMGEKNNSQKVAQIALDLLN